MQIARALELHTGDLPPSLSSSRSLPLSLSLSLFPLPFFFPPSERTIEFAATAVIKKQLWRSDKGERAEPIFVIAREKTRIRATPVVRGKEREGRVFSRCAAD